MRSPTRHLLSLVPLAVLLLGNSDCADATDDGYGSVWDGAALDSPDADPPPPATGDEPARSCVPAERLTCGEVTTADTGDWNDGATDVIDWWAISGGDTSGPEIAHIFTAQADELVEFRLLEVDPTLVDHDVYVLDGNMDCSPNEALAWGTESVVFEAEAHKSYYLVVDGRDGGAGPYRAELDCEGPPEPEPDPEPPPGEACDGLIGLSAEDDLAGIAVCTLVADPAAPAAGVWADGLPTYDVLSVDLCIAHAVHDFNDEPYLVLGGTMATSATDGDEMVWHTAFVDAVGETSAAMTDTGLTLTSWSAGVDVDDTFQTMVSVVYDYDSETMSYVLETRPWGLGDPEVLYSARLDCGGP